MRGSSCIGKRLPYSVNLSNATKQTLTPFSTSSSSSGDGRGRGRGASSPRFDLVAPRAPGQPDPDASKPDPIESSSSLGHGRGRGKPLVSSPIPPSFHSFEPLVKPPSTAAGRGGGPFNRVPGPPPEKAQEPGPKKPIFFKREDGTDAMQSNAGNDGVPDKKESALPDNVVSMLRGAGRGQPRRERRPEIPTEEANRHLRPARKSPAPLAAENPETRERRPPPPKMSREEAVKHAIGVLSQDLDGVEVGEGGRGRGGTRGRGGRGWGRGRGAWREQRGRYRDSDEGDETALYLGDNADGEKLAKRLGTEAMSKLAEGFEEMGDRVFPSPLENEYLDALDTNYKIEFEPEYLMGDFESNPDIDEKPPIPLRDALEKAKPFLMAYEGIQSQEEWEEIIKETMKRVPLLKAIVDHYSGPDRVTAKKQHEELERVAKTLPEKAPDSVKQFTERAVLTLQSNPGWGFDKKCQFMDKLVGRMSQQYK